MRTHPAVRPAVTSRVPVPVALRLQELLDGLVSRQGIHHAVLGVRSGDGTLSWKGATGIADPDGRPMQVDTPFWIASVTKLYIAAAVLRLMEQGRIDLDQPMVTYLPPELTDGLHRLRGTDHTPTITVRHLLGHTSGLPDYLTDSPRGGVSLWDQIFADDDRPVHIEAVTRTVRSELKPYFAPQPADARRQKAAYSDTNFRLLIAIIESVTGRALGDAFAELLFRPLDLRCTWIPGEAPPPDIQAPAAFWAGEDLGDRPACLNSLGDLYSTVDDTLTFMRGLVSGRVFDDPATVGLMQTRFNRFGFSLNPAPKAPTWPIEYGLGMMRLRLDGVLGAFLRVPPFVGHTGVSGSWLFWCPERDLYLTGTVGQAAAAALPFRFVPKVLQALGTNATPQK